jgi:hypothetical protein
MRTDLDTDLELFYLFLTGLFLLTGSIVWRRFRQRRLDPFEPLVWLSLYYLGAFGICSIPYLHGWLEPGPRLEPVSFWLRQAMGITLVGIVCLWIGYSLPRFRAPRLTPFNLLKGVEVRPAWAVALVGIGLLVQLYRLSRGEFGYLMVHESYQSTLGSSQIFSQLSVLGQFGFILAALDAFRHPGCPRRRLLFLVTVGVEVIATLISGMKGGIVYAGLNLTIVYFYLNGRLRARFIMPAILALLVLIPINFAYRQRINDGEVERTNLLAAGTTFISLMAEGAVSQEERQGMARWIVILEHLAMLRDTARVVRYAEETGDFWGGRHYGDLPLLIFVPRFLWSDKPVMDIGRWVSTVVMGNPRSMTHSQAITFAGDLYLNFGVDGVAVGFFLLGLLLRVIYQRYALQGDVSDLFLYLSLWVGLWNLDGAASIAGTARQFLMLLVIRHLAFSREPRQLRGVRA